MQKATEEQLDEGIEIEDFNRSIKFENVSFAYDWEH